MMTVLILYLTQFGKCACGSKGTLWDIFSVIASFLNVFVAGIAGNGIIRPHCTKGVVELEQCGAGEGVACILNTE